MRTEPLGQTHLLKALPLTRVRWRYRVGFNLCLRGPLTSGHSRYPECSFDYWKQKAWITDHKGHTNQRLTSLQPFIKPGVTDWLDPKDRHWPIQNKESPCLMPHLPWYLHVLYDHGYCFRFEHITQNVEILKFYSFTSRTNHWEVSEWGGFGSIRTSFLDRCM